MSTGDPLLDVADLHAGYGSLRAVAGITLQVNEGETVALDLHPHWFPGGEQPHIVERPRRQQFEPDLRKGNGVRSGRR